MLKVEFSKNSRKHLTNSEIFIKITFKIQQTNEFSASNDIFLGIGRLILIEIIVNLMELILNKNTTREQRISSMYTDQTIRFFEMDLKPVMPNCS